MIAKGCIFDFDGVVMDSEKYHHLAWEELAHEIGVEFTYEEYLPFKSAGRQVVIPYLLNKAGIAVTDQLYKKYSDLREEKIQRTLLNLNEKDITPGLVNFLHLLHEKGIKCAVASSSAAAHVTAQRFGLFNMFDAFVDGTQHLPNKPQPHLFLHAAQLLNLAPSQCVVFEDSINGLTAAKNAKMRCMGIQTYFCNLADRIIDDFTQANIDTITFEEENL